MKDFKIGDVVECTPLMSNMTPELITATVTSVADAQTSFDLYYFGVFLGTVTYSEEAA